MRDVFEPAPYLSRYYARPSADDIFTLRFLVKNVAPFPDGIRALEFGGGPTLSGPLVLARVAAEIHFSDYVPAALDAVRAWVAREPAAHDWSPYTRTILELEGARADAGAIMAREERLRSALYRLSACDARASEMLADPDPPYDVVAAHHCLDVAARDSEEFAAMVARLAEWLAPGGLFLLSVTTGATTYSVEQYRFACLDLDPEDAVRALTEAGFEAGRIAQAEAPAEDHEYSGVLLSAARRT